MPSQFYPLDEQAPIKGMNTYDDEKELQPGECVNLINCFPGSPPTPRTAVVTKLLASTNQYSAIPGAVIFTFNGSTYLAFWVYEQLAAGFAPAIYAYYLYFCPLLTTGSDAVSLGTLRYAGSAEQASTVHKMLAAHSNIYCFFNDAPYYWRTAQLANAAKVIEMSGANKAVRDIACTWEINVSAANECTIAEHADAGGPFANGDCLSYAFVPIRLGYVSDGASAYPWATGSTPTGMIAPPDAVTATKLLPQTYPSVFGAHTPGKMEGLEDSNGRKTVPLTAAGYVHITVASLFAQAIAQGMTHVRVYRSRVFNTGVAATDQANAKAATHYYLRDLPVLATQPTIYDDAVSDASLSGMSYQLKATDYSNPTANTCHAEIAKSRLWLFKNGVCTYSEVPGGDGGTDNEDAYAYPEKWFAWFKPITYRVDCESEDGQASRGIAALGDDLFMLKESKAYVLWKSDPSNARQCISETIGCAFPHTLTKGEFRGEYGKCLLFISNKGPAIITEGGNLRLFSEFKIAYLWPEKNGELFQELKDYPTACIPRVVAGVWDNCWLISYRLTSGTQRHIGFYFGDAETKYRGPFMIEFGKVTPGSGTSSAEQVIAKVTSILNLNQQNAMIGQSIGSVVTQGIQVAEGFKDGVYIDASS